MAQPRRNDFLVPTLAVIFDAIAIECSFLASYWIRFNTRTLDFLPLAENTPPYDAYLYGSLVVVPVWLLLFNARKMYGARRNVPLTDELFSIVRLVTLGMLVVMSGAFFYRAFSYSRVVFGLVWLTATLFILLGRVLLNAIERWMYRSGKDLRNAVIIGSGKTASTIFTTLGNHPLLGYRFIGYCAAAPAPDSDPLASIRYLGPPEMVPQLLPAQSVELALVALGSGDHRMLHALLQECEGLNVEFMMVPDLLELMTSGLTVQELEGIQFIRLKGIPMTTWGRILKRIFDVIVSGLLLFVFSPLLLFLACAVKLTSRGPVFFLQERLGLDGHRFNMLKFRSMSENAESKTGPVWASSDDPRRTPIGRFLRTTSLDEFPQLLNVLRGEMSLVGPRPERPYFVDQFKGLIPKYLDRHLVKTGMTGWAQVNGLRGNSSLEERIRYDIYYIEHWSIGFDIRILIKTFGALISK